MCGGSHGSSSSNSTIMRLVTGVKCVAVGPVINTQVYVVVGNTLATYHLVQLRSVLKCGDALRPMTTASKAVRCCLSLQAGASSMTWQWQARLRSVTQALDRC